MSAQLETHTYSIKEASSLSGLPASTLRYYESIGIIKPINRDVSSKQRVYNDDDLDALTSVACLQATGMNISYMRSYINNAQGGAESANDQVAILSSQKQYLTEEVKLLKVRQQYVDFKIEYWRAIGAGYDRKAKEISAKARKLASILNT